MAQIVIRLRGVQNINPQTKDTLRYLRLNRVNHCVVLPDNETTTGMLQRAKDYLTWGPAAAESVAELIRTRGRLAGDRPITDAHVKATTKYADIAAFAAAVCKGEIQYKELAEVKPLFRLHPARKGLEGIKRSYRAGGALGPRGESINDLVGRMVGGA